MNEEQPAEQPAADTPTNEPLATPPVRNDPPAPDPRRRLRELLAIPDHQRTDAIWDEIIELEICLAPGNRVQGAPGMPQEPGRRQAQGQQGQGRRPEQRRPDAITGAKPAKRFFKKSKRPPGSPPKA